MAVKEVAVKEVAARTVVRAAHGEGGGASTSCTAAT